LKKDQLIKQEPNYRSMAGKILGLVAISILLSTILIMALSSDQDAEAKPSKQSPKHKFSKWAKNKVCNDQLCDGIPIYKAKQKIGTGSPNK
jgi:hypothetical protein